MNIFNTLLIHPIFNILIGLYDILGDLGLAIVALTLLVRFALLPLANKQVRAQRRLQVLQPELAKLNEKHKGDRETLARETMAFYKREGVNPAASCLPLLVQLPFLIAIYYIFNSYAINDNHLKDLYSFIPNPGHINTISFGFLDLAKRDPLILPAIAAALQFIQARMLLPKGNDKNSQLSRQMAYLFPVITFAISSGLPAALPLYWAVTTLFSVIQQYVIIKTLPAAEARKEGAADWNKANPADPIDVAAKPSKRKGKKASVTVRQRKK